MIGDWPGELEFLRAHCTEEEIGEAICWEIYNEEPTFLERSYIRPPSRRFKAIKEMEAMGISRSTRYRVLTSFMEKMKNVQKDVRRVPVAI